MDSRSDTLVRPGADMLGLRSVAAAAVPKPADTTRRTPQLDSPQTQVLPDRAGDLGEIGDEIGQRLGPDRLELFVATDAAQAMQEQIAHHAPDFIALHDVGGSSGLRLLAAIGAARRTPLQQLVIRRQGQGVALATLRFVELESRGGRRLRLYSTDVDADSQGRRQLARVLMGHAKLAVMMIGELPGHALDTALAPWRDAIRTGAWCNRELLMLPLSTASRLGEHAARLAGDGQVNVVVSAAAAKPNEAWAVIAGAWNRMRSASRHAASLRGKAATSAMAGATATSDDRAATPALPAAPAPSAAPAVPVAAAAAAVAPNAQAGPLIERMMSLAAVREGMGAAPPACDVGDARPPFPSTCDRSGGVATPGVGPHIATVPAADASPRPMYDRYLRACGEIKGLMSACIFEARSGECLAHVGGRPDPGPLTAQGMRMYAMLAESGYALGLGASQPGAMITLTQHHLLLHPLPGHPGVVMHAVLDGSVTDPTLAQLQLRRIDGSALGAHDPG